jgi:predicted transcriptional regulator
MNTVKVRETRVAVFTPKQSKLSRPVKKKSAIDEGIADVKAGRIIKIDNPKSLITECLK